MLTAGFALASPPGSRAAVPAVLKAESDRFIDCSPGTVASFHRSPERFVGVVPGAVAITVVSVVGPAEPGSVLLPRLLSLSFRGVATFYPFRRRSRSTNLPHYTT